MILTVVEFVLGSFMHFLYDVCPSFLTAIISPMSESVFEHLKLALYPMLFTSLIVLWYRHKINDRTLTALFYGILTSLMSIVFIYYFYRFGLGIESVLVDIALLFVAIALGNYVRTLIYKHHFVMSRWMLIIAYFSLILVFILLTLKVPQLPLFIP